MSTEIKLPSLGEGIESGDVLEILVKVGDVIKKNQSLVEMETDKATVSVPSPLAGKILSLAIKEGQTVKVGMVLASIDAVGTVAPQAPVAVSSADASSVRHDAAVAPHAPVAQPPVVAPKVEAPSTPAPIAVAPTKPTAPIFVPAAPVTLVASAQPAPADTGTPFTDDVIAAGPAIRRFAREVGVDLASVAGTGDGGRITRDDILAVVRQANQSARSAPPTSVINNTATIESDAPTSKPATSTKGTVLPGTAANDDYGPIRVDRMTKIRKTIAAQMQKSWSTVPRVVNFDDADITDLEAIRQASKDDYASRGIKLTTMPFLIKAVATALKHHPALNATIDMENEQIIYKDYVNIGIAVDGEKGLVVPTLKNADRMSIPDIAYALSDLSSRVRSNSYAVSDLRGGTFTISNLGAIGGTYSTPIVNVPEVAILLVGRSRKMPIVMDDDSIKARLMMPLSLAYDHRSVDGATAARFLNDIIAYLEAPSRLLLAI